MNTLIKDINQFLPQINYSVDSGRRTIYILDIAQKEEIKWSLQKFLVPMCLVIRL